ncbi:hypothetical protein [Bacteroides graminisolvens]|uniref:hypothetical protein n=1 Tax=Bacteroides graminisolvens TaxID=477666 RepID=UPI002409F334|nr:hypothetical protein [Bacteroides graminisolvens]
MNDEFSIDELLQLSVKIECNHEKEYSLGTGTIISDGDKFYVMTAGHNIKKEDGNPYELSEIKITMYSCNAWKTISLIGIIGKDFTDEKDYALLEITFPESIFDYNNSIKCCDTVIDAEQYICLGYTQIANDGRIFPLKRCSISGWHLVESNINNQEIEAHKLMGGNSGAGVFFKRYGVYYCVGYLKRTLDIHGSYNDIIVYPSSNFDILLPSSTKEENLAKLVEKWLDIDAEVVDAALRIKYKQENIENFNHLDRKVKILFSDKNVAMKKFDKFLDNFLHGLELVRLMHNNTSLLKKLEKADKKVFEDFNDYRSGIFANDTEALQDLSRVKDELIKTASQIFLYDDAEKSISRGYANYSIAMKLLLCSLDYKQKEK